METKDIVSKEFLRDFKAFLFYSCDTQNPEKSKLCTHYSSDFESDLSSFELPETSEFEGMDAKLSKLLKNLLDTAQLNSINVGNFMPILLINSQSNSTSLMRDSYRFVICLYIDLILIDENSVNSETDNINENIKSMIKRIVLPIYEHHLKTFV